MNNLFVRICALVLLVSLIHVQAPVADLAAQKAAPGKADGITKNAPELLVSPEIVGQPPESPKTEQKETGKTSYTWLWVALGAVVVGAAAAGSGGGGGGGVADTGSISVGW
jgi:hypothetical protein